MFSAESAGGSIDGDALGIAVDASMGQPYRVQLIGSYLWDDIEDLARGMTARDARRALADGTSSAASMRLPPETPACQPPETPSCQHLEPAADAARWEAHQHNRHSTADSRTGSPRFRSDQPMLPSSVCGLVVPVLTRAIASFGWWQ